MSKKEKPIYFIFEGKRLKLNELKGERHFTRIIDKKIHHFIELSFYDGFRTFDFGTDWQKWNSALDYITYKLYQLQKMKCGIIDIRLPPIDEINPDKIKYE